MWTVKGHDGRTAYQRVRGKPFRTRLPALGEIVRYKLRPQEPIANSWDGRRFHSGIFLGIDQRTGQYMMYGDHGVKYARTILRLPDAEKWNSESLQALNITPKSLHVPKELEVVFKDKPAQEAPLEPKPIVARQVYIKQADIDRFGFTRVAHAVIMIVCPIHVFSKSRHELHLLRVHA